MDTIMIARQRIFSGSLLQGTFVQTYKRAQGQVLGIGMCLHVKFVKPKS